MIITKIQMNGKSTPKFFTPDELISKFTKVVGERKFYICEELVHWVREGHGRLGSHFQIGQDMYIKVIDENDDYTKYYNPEPKKVSQSSKNWCNGSCDCDGNCGSGCKC